MPKRHTQSSSSTAGSPPKRRSQDMNSSCRDTSNSTTTNCQPNFDSSCPYQILGVPRNATIQQIKLSYRKLALKHHPDRQSSEADKDTAHHIFSSIGHAYEMLSDERKRREYDEGLQQEQYNQQHRQQSRGGFDHGPFDGHFFSSSPFGFGFGGNTQSSRQRSNQPSDFHNFTDPFQLFEQFFADELGRNSNNNSQRQQRQQQSGMRSDSFASDPFFSDPFFSSGIGGFGQSSMMSQMMNMQHGSMHGSMHNQQLMGGGGGGMSSSSFFSSSSSSSRHGGGIGQSVSTSTRTTIVNGRRQTITERTITHPNGRVERHVTTDGGDNNGSGRLASLNHPALDYDRRSGRR